MNNIHGIRHSVDRSSSAASKDYSFGAKFSHITGRRGRVLNAPPVPILNNALSRLYVSKPRTVLIFALLCFSFYALAVSFMDYMMSCSGLDFWRTLFLGIAMASGAGSDHLLQDPVSSPIRCTALVAFAQLGTLLAQSIIVAIFAIVCLSPKSDVV